MERDKIRAKDRVDSSVCGRGECGIGADSSIAEIVQLYEQDGFVRIRILSMPVDPQDLGRILVDAARMCAEAYRRDERASSAAPYLDRIMEGVELEIESPSAPIGDPHASRRN